MAAAELTEKVSTLLTGAFLRVMKIKQATQYDWVILPYKGIWQVAGRLPSGALATILRGTLTVNNTGTAYTATTTTIAYDGGSVTRGTDSFYIETVSGEIMEVIDSNPTGAAGNLTVKKRGCFGTTPSGTGLANENTLYVLNNLVLGDNQTGAVTVSFLEMPENPGAPLFA
jgi:hypothetical protein